MDLNEATNVLQKRTEEIQKESHDFIEHMMNLNPNLVYQDTLAIFLYAKIAALELHIEKIIKSK